jgi:DNA-binding beta-propeller fold protein YncE
MNNRKIFFSSIIGLAFNLIINSCSASQPNAPYAPDTSASSRNKITAAQSANLYALLLSPTHDQLELLDLVDNRVTLSVSTGRNPVELSVSPDHSHILVINQLDGTISEFFREDNQHISTIGTVGSGSNPTDVTFNNKGTEAYVAYQGTGRINVLQILNRARPVLKNTLTLKNNAAGVVPSPYKLAVSSDDNFLYAVDRNTGTLYTFRKTNDDFVQENFFDLSSNDQKTLPEDMLFFDNKLYISDSANARIIIFDTTTNQVTGSLSLASQEVKNEILPGRMAINTVAKKLYVANQGSSTIGVLDLTKNTLIKHIFLSRNTASDSFEPSDISVSSNGNTVYVTNTSGRNLSIISGKDDTLLRNIGTTASSGAIAPLSAIEII